MSKPLSVPKRPLEILTPFPRSVPSPTALRLLSQSCLKLLKSTETFSVTFSDLPCPAGKNFLFTLKPYYWEVEPGKWEPRDGQRNPYCDRPGGQRQLQTMAVAVHTLALGAKHLDDVSANCVFHLDKLLRVFFIDEETRMIPEVWYAQCNPGSNPLKGDHAFEIAIRYLILVSQALRLIKDLLDQELLQGLEQWFAAQVEWMRTSEQGIGARGYGDNKAIWYHAILASHLYCLSPIQGETYALSWWRAWIADHPTPEAFFERELRRTRPRHYSVFILEPTFILVDLLRSADGLAPDVANFLASLIDFARRIEPSVIEVELEADVRYKPKVDWYARMLEHWTKGETEGGIQEPDGQGWELGWTQRMRMMWGMV